MRPAVVRTRVQLAQALAAAREQGCTVALVPTMGALHEAHAALVRRAVELADVVVVSLFVNPLQFGPGEDLDRYPRPFDDDVRLVGEVAGPAVTVFAPSVDEVYPDGEPVVRVDAGALGAMLEGAARPGHFDGVLTVVLKLVGIVRPDVVVFGAKDAQQLVLVRRMVRDLDVPVRVEHVETVRAPDGLALSSRNRYLDGESRVAATALSRALVAGREAAAAGAAPEEVEAAARRSLSAAAGVDVDYLVLVDPSTLGPVHGGDGLLLVAARVGGTRLIDSLPLQLPVPPQGAVR